MDDTESVVVCKKELVLNMSAKIVQNGTKFDNG